MEKKIYIKPDVKTVIVPEDICEEGPMKETRWASGQADDPDNFWIIESDVPTASGFTTAKKSLWDDEEDLFSDDDGL